MPSMKAETTRPKSRRRRWPVRAGAVSLVVFAVWVTFAGRLLLRHQRPTRSDAVVVFSGDELGLRLRRAEEVFRSTGSGRLVVFVEPTDPRDDPFQPTAEAVAGQGIDLANVRLLRPGGSTAEEAGIASALARRCGWRSLIVVTTPEHTARAGWLTRRAVGPAVRVQVVADEEPFRPGVWWSDPNSRSLVFDEWMKGLASIEYLFSAPTGTDPGVPC
jgi:uncharacterized SAM-binding protein YcdF (DUF218 family)